MGEQDDKAAWRQLAARLRAAGGVVDNIRMGRGARGRGLFVERKGTPSRLVIPPAFLIPVEAVELRDAALVVKQNADVPPEVSAFFDEYHASIGFARDIHRDARRAILGQHALPGPLQDMILKGDPKGQTRFPAFKEDSVLGWFLSTRRIEYVGENVLMPMMELINHDASGARFVQGDHGISVESASEGEILVQYHSGDPWSVYVRWGFAAPSDRVYALGLEVTEPAGWQIQIRAETRSTNPVESTTITVQGKRLIIDRMMLNGPGGVANARALFRSQVAAYDLADADELFSLIAKINKDWFTKILTLSKGSGAKPGLKEVRAAAKLQLKLLTDPALK